MLFLVRLKFTVGEIWSPDFKAENSDAIRTSHTKAKEIESKLEELYDAEKTSNNRIHAHVIQIR